MAFTVPTMPLEAVIYRWQLDDTLVVVGECPCNVAMGRRLAAETIDFVSEISEWVTQILVPAGTDVRDWLLTFTADLIEVVPGSGRVYQVQYVADLGLGFPNEHRCAACTRSTSLGPWPSPLPPVFGEPVEGVVQVGDRVVGRNRPTRATVRA